MLEGVTIEQLRTLLAVAEEGSFSAAARKLGRVQAAVSQSIDRLEAQLGLRLFDRTARIPSLTQHGRSIIAATTTIQAPGERGSVDHGVFSKSTWRVVDLMTKHALILGGLGWGHPGPVEETVAVTSLSMRGQ